MKTLTVVAVLAATLTVVACDQSSGTQSQPTAEAPAPKPKITPEERAKIVQAATAGMSLDRDKMESISFYSVKGDRWVGTGLTLYVSVPDDASPILRIMPRYSGDSWIFFKSMKVMADSVIVYDKQYEYLKMKRDNGGGMVYERIDYAAQPDDIEAMRKIANAKSVTIRLSGDDKREDFDLDVSAQKKMQRVLKAYDDMATLQ
ncbi:hypothetical protein [Burkholderia gladioli]|uniref:hypothetical protein n=1 Tax=Burkholderia gladioli TaxID=28095 RepID=UPI001640B751|nr:hypothetical protein [Burkholderia gladioli]